MSVFRFKQFSVKQELSAMKVGTDAMLLGSLVESKSPGSILDIGSGTGVISLMMAQRFPEANCTGIELDEASAFEALENFQASPWTNNLEVIQSDFLEYSFSKKYDLIVSNPPYYQSRLENSDPRKTRARHESALPMEAMLEKVSGLLSHLGTLWVIVPVEVWKKWIDAATTHGLQCIGRKDIYGKKGGEVKRVVLAFALSTLQLDPQEMIFTEFDKIFIRNSEGNYTQQYIELTKEFHYQDLKAKM